MKQALLLLGALLVCAGAFAAEPQQEITVDHIIEAMNVHRAGEGLAPLRRENRLMKAASDRMKHMEDVGFWSHESPEGLTPFVWITARDYHYQYAAENLAAGFETVRLLVESWMESPGHRANIMSPNFDECGIAIIEGATTGRATGRSVVVLFAAQFPPVVAGAGQ